MTGEEMLKITADELDRLLSPAHVVGQAVDLGDKAVIPIAEFGFGMGAGGGKGKEGEGEGAGCGGKIAPVALVLVHKDVKGPDGIQVLSLHRDNPVAQIINALSESLAPQVIKAIKAMSDSKGAKMEE
ncbi:MAG TPA: spore germination protein GerW family protein [Methanolinea sp.]|nr:spore germination protein GerW family protein [Methanolinea sp.]HQK55995.1 spore germination protein GerW family protein [Methanolinea sp.]